MGSGHLGTDVECVPLFGDAVLQTAQGESPLIAEVASGYSVSKKDVLFSRSWDKKSDTDNTFCFYDGTSKILRVTVPNAMMQSG